MAKLIGLEPQDFQVPFPVVRLVQFTKVRQKHIKGSKQCLLHPSSEIHSLAQYKRFLSMEVKDRWVMVKDNKLCFMRLGYDHASKDCRSM